MALFDDLGKKLSNVAQNTVQKSKDLAETAKLNMAIAGEEKEIRKAYAEIGQWYFSKNRFDPAAEVVSQVQKIQGALAKIEELRSEHKDEKLEFHCHSCGEIVSADDKFCPGCGANLRPLVEE